MDFFREQPVRSWLQSRETIIPRPKLLDVAPTFRTVPLIPLPEKVAPEDAIEIIAGTSWARGIAEGTANKGGLTGESKETFIRNYAYQIAQGIFESSYLPRAPFRERKAPAPPTTPRPAGRKPAAEKTPGRPPATTKPPTVVVGEKGITREELERRRKERLGTPQPPEKVEKK